MAVPVHACTSGRVAVPIDLDTRGRMAVPTDEDARGRAAVPVDRDTRGRMAVPVPIDGGTRGRAAVPMDRDPTGRVAVPVDRDSRGRAVVQQVLPAIILAERLPFCTFEQASPSDAIMQDWVQFLAHFHQVRQWHTRSRLGCLPDVAVAGCGNGHRINQV
jgi:hypothetical protein